MIKGVSDYADENKSKTDSWRRFASLMAASLTAEILSDLIVFENWPHYESKCTNNSVGAFTSLFSFMHKFGRYRISYFRRPRTKTFVAWESGGGGSTSY